MIRLRSKLFFNFVNLQLTSIYKVAFMRKSYENRIFINPRKTTTPDINRFLQTPVLKTNKQTEQILRQRKQKVGRQTGNRERKKKKRLSVSVFLISGCLCHFYAFRKKIQIALSLFPTKKKEKKKKTSKLSQRNQAEKRTFFLFVNFNKPET